MGDRPNTPAAVGAYLLTSLAHALVAADVLLGLVVLVGYGNTHRFPVGLGALAGALALAAVTLYFRASDLSSRSESEPRDHRADDVRS
jgi:hypothetical protein